MGRHANPDIRRAFEEFQDQDTPSKCNKVRCLHCGFVRAKNTTRQIEHLQDCQRYLTSPEAQAHLLAQEQQQQQQPPQQNGLAMDSNMAPGPSQILSGQQPNPNLQVNRRGPNSKRTRDGQPIAPNIAMTPNVAPSLTSHLLIACRLWITRSRTAVAMASTRRTLCARLHTLHRAAAGQDKAAADAELAVPSHVSYHGPAHLRLE
jgi:hypothetical protein